MRAGAAVTVALVACAIAACQATTTGTARPGAGAGETTTAAVPAFDPCTAFTTAQLDSAGLSTGQPPEPYSAGSDLSTESGCRWLAVPGGSRAAFSASLGRSARTVDEYLANPTFEATETTVAGRRTINFATSTSASVCSLALQIDGGSAVVSISPIANRLVRDESCIAAQRIVESIATALP